MVTQVEPRGRSRRGQFHTLISRGRAAFRVLSAATTALKGVPDGSLEFWDDTTLSKTRAQIFSLGLNQWTEFGVGHLGLAPVQTVTASSVTLNGEDHIVICDCTSNAITVNLPAASTSGRIYSIKKIDASGNAVTVDGNGSETIDGATTATISSQYDDIRIVSDGSNWHII